MSSSRPACARRFVKVLAGVGVATIIMATATTSAKAERICEALVCQCHCVQTPYGRRCTWHCTRRCYWREPPRVTPHYYYQPPPPQPPVISRPPPRQYIAPAIPPPVRGDPPDPTFALVALAVGAVVVFLWRIAALDTARSSDEKLTRRMRASDLERRMQALAREADAWIEDERTRVSGGKR